MGNKEITREEKLDKIYKTIPHDTETLYRCNRVREAWNYGTMGREDFEEVSPKIMISDVLHYFKDLHKKKNLTCPRCKSENVNHEEGERFEETGQRISRPGFWCEDCDCEYGKEEEEVLQDELTYWYWIRIDLLNYWEDERKPIDDNPEAIDYIYSLFNEYPHKQKGINTPTNEKF